MHTNLRVRMQYFEMIVKTRKKWGEKKWNTFMKYEKDLGQSHDDQSCKLKIPLTQTSAAEVHNNILKYIFMNNLSYVAAQSS